MSVIRRILAGPPPPQRDTFAPADPEPGLYGLGVGLHGRKSAPPAPISTVNAIITVISQSCGALPRHIIERDGRGRKPIDNPAFRYLTGKPNRLTAMTGNSYWEAVFASLEGWGNAYAWVSRLPGDPMRPPWQGVEGLYFLMPQRVRARLADDGRRPEYIIDGNRAKPYGRRDVLQAAKGMLDGVEGISPLRAGAMTHQLAHQAESTALAFFRRGATVGGVVMHPEKMEQSEVDAFYENMEEWHQGGRRAGNILLLQGNAKYDKIGIPPNEAQFLETRHFEREELVGWYSPSIPPHLLGWRASASNWGTGVEQQTIGFVSFTLLPRLRHVEELIGEELLPPDLQYRFELKGILRGDSKARAEVMAKMRQWGALSREEWRALEDMPPLDAVEDDVMAPHNAGRISTVTGDQIPMAPPGKANGTRPAPPPSPAGAMHGHLVGEMRCGNDACPSRRHGGPGALLARNVGAATVVCRQCHEPTTLAGSERLRDVHDLVDAVVEDLAVRLA